MVLFRLKDKENKLEQFTISGSKKGQILSINFVPE